MCCMQVDILAKKLMPDVKFKIDERGNTDSCFFEDQNVRIKNVIQGYKNHTKITGKFLW